MFLFCMNVSLLWAFHTPSCLLGYSSFSKLSKISTFFLINYTLLFFTSIPLPKGLTYFSYYKDNPLYPSDLTREDPDPFQTKIKRLSYKTGIIICNINLPKVVYEKIQYIDKSHRKSKMFILSVNCIFFNHDLPFTLHV